MKFLILTYLFTATIIMSGCQSIQFVDSPIPVKNNTIKNTIINNNAVKKIPVENVRVKATPIMPITIQNSAP